MSKEGTPGTLEGANKLSLEGEVETFLKRDFSRNTLWTYRQVLGVFLSWMGGRYPEVASVGQLRLEHIEEFRSHLSRKLSPVTQRKYLSVLRSFMNYSGECLGEKVLSPESIRLPRAVVRPRAPLLVEYLEALLAQPDPHKPWGLRDRALIAVLASTGLRVSQLVGLNRQDVSANLLGKTPILPLAKKDYPSVVLDHRAQQYLGEYLACRQDPDPALFIRYKPGREVKKVDSSRRLSRQMVNRLLREYAGRANLSFPLSPNYFRLSSGAKSTSLQ